MSPQSNISRKPEKSPERAKSSWRRSSTTTRILENVELLIALHESQENEGQGELAKLIQDFDSWKKQSHELIEETNSLVADVEKQTSQQLTEQLDAKAGDIVQTLESKIGERFDRLDRRICEIAETVNHQQANHQALNPLTENDAHDIAELLSQQGVELEARFDLFTEHFDEQTDRVLESVKASEGNPSAGPSNAQLATTLADLSQRIEKISEFFEIQESLREIGDSVPDAALVSKLVHQQQCNLAENIDLLTRHVDEKSLELTQSIQAQMEQQLEQRFEQLNDHVAKITSALAGQQVLLESGNASSGDSDSPVVEQVNQRIEMLTGSLNSRINDLFGDLGIRISQISESIARQGISLEAPVVAERKDDTVSHWLQQKTAMLSKYGIDPDYRPVMETPATEEAKPETQMEEVTENLESLHDSIDNISAADAEAIENLKEELTSKLRDAEVEFSINRAKLSQLKAELDGKQVELERKAAALEEKFGGLNSPAKTSGFLDRLAAPSLPSQTGRAGQLSSQQRSNQDSQTVSLATRIRQLNISDFFSIDVKEIATAIVGFAGHLVSHNCLRVAPTLRKYRRFSATKRQRHGRRRVIVHSGRTKSISA